MQLLQLLVNLRSLQPGRIPGIAMAVACAVAAATQPAWISIPVAGVRGNPVPVTVAAVPVKAGGVRGAPSAARESIERPGRPTCAGAAKEPSTDESGSAGPPGGSVGCGLPPNLAAVEPARFADFALQRQDAIRQQA